MDLTRASIEKNRITIVAIAVLIVAGLSSYITMPRAMDPGFVLRVAQVRTAFPGASPERVEQLVTDPIEQAIQEIPELDYIVSSSKTGMSVITVSIREEYTEMRPIWDNLRRKVERVGDQLPSGVMEPEVIDEFADTYPILVSLIAEGFSYQELRVIGDQIRDELLRIEDVSKVDIVGNQRESIYLEYDNATLASSGLSPQSLQRLLQAQNIVSPGGEIRVGDEEIVLEPTGNFESVEELANTLILLPDANSVARLGDLTNVRRAYEEPPGGMVRINGEAGLILAVSMREGGNLVSLGRHVTRLLDALPANYPHGVEFGLAFFEPTTVNDEVNNFVMSVLQAVGAVLLVMFLTLGLRTGSIVASLIPTTMIITMFVMSSLGIFLDQISLCALIIALGLLVDNAIVMAESIMVKMEEGAKPIEAAVTSGRELRTPLLVSSATTACSFLPIYLAESMVGEFTAPIFEVVTISLLISWVLALTLTPTLCVLFLKIKKAKPDQFDTKTYAAYRSALRFLLRNRWITIGCVVGLFVVSLSLLRYIPSMFFPASDRTVMTSRFMLPAGTPIERTAQMTDALEDFIREELLASDERPEGVVSWTSYVGSAPPRFILSASADIGSDDTVHLMMNTSSPEVIAHVQDQLERFAAEHFPGAALTGGAIATGPPVTRPIQVRVSGRDNEMLFGAVEQVYERLRQFDGTRNIEDDWGPRLKKFVVFIDQARARRAGISNHDIALSLRTFLTGLETTQYREGDQTIPVVLRSSAGVQEDLERLSTLNVYSESTGSTVPISQLANVEVVFQPSVIYRRDRYRTVNISCDLAPGLTAAEVVGELQPWLDEVAPSWGVEQSYELGGEAESSNKANASIMAKLPVAGLLIVFLLVVQFNSIRRPIIVLVTIPLALIGVIIGLLVMKSYFGFMTLLGVVSLAGIVINNAIVLLDRIKLEIEEFGRTPQEAIVEAAQRRARPILLTTATTVASLVPLYLSGPMFSSMAVAIGYGLVLATMLTLGVVPVLYSLLFRVRFTRES